MLILGIESSCDETAAAVVEDGRRILSNVIATQIAIHKKFGGVVPEVASRNHVVDIIPVIEEALDKSGKSLEDIDLIASTYGPGLVGALLVGLTTAKALALSHKKPFLGINHMQGHIAANYLAHQDLEPPFVSLVVSGGHTNIMEVLDYTTFHVLGETVDDAAGEAYDKVARVIGLGYPGGIQVDQLAATGEVTIDFPRGLEKEESYNFSFSGLKSAVINYVHQKNMKNQDWSKADVAASFQEAVARVLTQKTVKAVEDRGYDKIVLSGGVSANSRLRESMQTACKAKGWTLYYPPAVLCGDNAAMIASAAYFKAEQGDFSPLNLKATPYLRPEK